VPPLCYTARPLAAPAEMEKGALGGEHPKYFEIDGVCVTLPCHRVSLVEDGRPSQLSWNVHALDPT